MRRLKISVHNILSVDGINELVPHRLTKTINYLHFLILLSLPMPENLMATNFIDDMQCVFDLWRIIHLHITAKFSSIISLHIWWVGSSMGYPKYRKGYLMLLQ